MRGGKRMRKTNHEYVLTSYGEFNQLFFLGFFEADVVMTQIMPKTFPNKKKAKRVQKRLNKIYLGQASWGIIDYNIWKSYCRKVSI